MTVPQYLPKRPSHPGEMVPLEIHIVGNGLRAVPPMPTASENPPHCGKRNVGDAVPYII